MSDRTKRCLLVVNVDENLRDGLRGLAEDVHRPVSECVRQMLTMCLGDKDLMRTIEAASTPPRKPRNGKPRVTVDPTQELCTPLARGPMTLTDLASAWSCHKATAQRRLNDLRRRGIVRPDVSETGRGYTWTLVQSYTQGQA